MSSVAGVISSETFFSERISYFFLHTTTNLGNLLAYPLVLLPTCIFGVGRSVKIKAGQKHNIGGDSRGLGKVWMDTKSIKIFQEGYPILFATGRELPCVFF